MCAVSAKKELAAHALGCISEDYLSVNINRQTGPTWSGKKRHLKEHKSGSGHLSCEFMNAH